MKLLNLKATRLFIVLLLAIVTFSSCTVLGEEGPNGGAIIDFNDDGVFDVLILAREPLQIIILDQ
ncbi:MAG TPA: hypothetical protein VD993_19150 [Chitinophagaceae bacterium]|nr:hypothetical protein [Chitinophagaceae bacterium]